MDKRTYRVKNKLYDEVYSISTKHLNDISELEFFICADMHYHENVDKNIFEELIDYCLESNPDFIILPGDLIETIDFIDDVLEKEYFESIIKRLSAIAPVIIIPGNHEISQFSKDKFLNDNKAKNVKALNYLNSLSKMENVYFLNNKNIKLKGINFIGFSPSLKTYMHSNLETTKIFLEEFKNKRLEISEQDFNVLLTHSSIPLVNSYLIEEKDEIFKNIDLIVSAHLHDGYQPKIFDRFKNNKTGLFFTPLVSPIPGVICRGLVPFGRGYLFVSQGFRKWTANIGIFNLLEKYCANDVERIKIKRLEK